MPSAQGFTTIIRLRWGRHQTHRSTHQPRIIARSRLPRQRIWSGSRSARSTARRMGPRLSSPGLRPFLANQRVLEATSACYAEGWVRQHEGEADLRLGEPVARFLAVRVMGDQRVAEMHLGLLVVLDQQIGLANGVVGWRQLLPADGDEPLDLGSLFRRGSAVEQMFLGDRQHAARPAGRVIDGQVPSGMGMSSNSTIRRITSREVKCSLG